MKVSDLEASFRTDVDDAAKPYLWPSDEFLIYLNEAEQEAAIRKKLLFEKVRSNICTINATVADGSVYKINPLIIEIVYASITDANGLVQEVFLIDRDELDRIEPGWRYVAKRPKYMIHRDNTVEFGCILDGSYTLNLETHRLPLNCLSKDADEPEINRVHHRRLLDWVKYRAYMKPDSETFNQSKSENSLRDFEDYFGVRPDADMRKAENANRPHRVKTYW